jgi:hypothetical protein|eukprot:5514569-Prymnesium_polylepis.1
MLTLLLAATSFAARFHTLRHILAVPALATCYRNHDSKHWCPTLGSVDALQTKLAEEETKEELTEDEAKEVWLASSVALATATAAALCVAPAEAAVMQVLDAPFFEYPGMAHPGWFGAGGFPEVMTGQSSLYASLLVNAVLFLSVVCRGAPIRTRKRPANTRSSDMRSRVVVADYFVDMRTVVESQESEPSLFSVSNVSPTGLTRTIPSDLQWLAGTRLPSWDELADSCHLIAEGFFLCSTPTDKGCQVAVPHKRTLVSAQCY